MKEQQDFIEPPKALLGMTPDELTQLVKDLNMPRFAGKQIADWLYKKQVQNIDEMSNLSKKDRETLKSKGYIIGSSAPIEAMRSIDGTIKYLYKTNKDHFIEAVYIPDEERATLCISSQVGCKMNCKFCMTGKQGFSGQLSVDEILNQVYSLPERDSLTNLVLMGMGEPLDNLDHVLKALHILTSEWGYGWSPRRITVSTIGLQNGLERFIEESECHLAVSLHAPVSSLRASLMPAERAFPIRDIIDLLRNYDWSKQRRLSFEYIVFKGVNDSLLYAKELVKLLRGVDCRVNLIRFHAIPEVALEGVDPQKMTELRDYLTKNGVFCTVRASRGEDIFAACGMLSTAKNELNQDTKN